MIRIATGDEQKTAFYVKQGLIAYTVMPFGQTNTPALFQEMVDTICKHMEGGIQYVDNILVCNGNTKAEYKAIVKRVLQQCFEHVLAVNLLYCEFIVQETIFLRHVINGQEVEIDPSKLEMMFKQPIPTQKKEVQAFLGFANYYCQLIINYSAKASPFIKITKDVSFT